MALYACIHCFNWSHWLPRPQISFFDTLIKVTLLGQKKLKYLPNSTSFFNSMSC